MKRYEYKTLSNFEELISHANDGWVLEHIIEERNGNPFTIVVSRKLFDSTPQSEGEEIKLPEEISIQLNDGWSTEEGIYKLEETVNQIIRYLEAENARRREKDL